MTCPGRYPTIGELDEPGFRNERLPIKSQTRVLLDLMGTLYYMKHALTLTGNYSLLDLVDHKRIRPAIVRRRHDMQGW